ncbi:MAG: hypothetical protein WDO56_35630, partial [Gammaproteobacteria bacterium]
MIDPIIKEIRELRARNAKEFWRDPAKFMADCNRSVRAMASNVVQTGPHTFRATFTLPLTKQMKKKKQHI